MPTLARSRSTNPHRRPLNVGRGSPQRCHPRVTVRAKLKIRRTVGQFLDLRLGQRGARKGRITTSADKLSWRRTAFLEPRRERQRSDNGATDGALRFRR